jgi:capreomycidine synthase
MVESRPPGNGEFPLNLLEEWLRNYYFRARFDISSSGVEPLTMTEFCQLVGLHLGELEKLVFHDSDSFAGPELRAALAKRFAGGDESRVMATHGSSEALFLLLNVLTDAPGEVVVLDPAYQQLYSIAEQRGCVVKRWVLRESNGFRPDLGELRKLVNTKTRLIVLNFPHNPTGVSVTREELGQIVNLASSFGCYLLWDAAFAELTHDGEPLPDPCTQYERAVSTGTLSKAYGLPGLRLGWCVAPREVLEKCVRLRDYVSLFLSPLVEFFGCKAVEHGDSLVSRSRLLARNNLEHLRKFAHELPNDVELNTPQGGACTLLKLKRIPDVEQFCVKLLEEQDTLLVPGTCFGLPEYVRLGFGCNEAVFLEGLRRLRNALELS